MLEEMGAETVVPCECDEVIDLGRGTCAYAHTDEWAQEQVRVCLQVQRSGFGLGIVEGMKIVEGVEGEGGRTVTIGSISSGSGCW